MNKLDYLITAERAGWHLLDFSVSDAEFAQHFVFEMYRPGLMDALVTYTGFSEWRGLTDVLRLDQHAVMAELEACLEQAAKMNSSLDVYECAAYVEVNEYAQFCFDRLAAYIDSFHFDVNEVLDEDDA